LSIFEKTEIEGLYFTKNLYTNSKDNKYFHVIASEGPGISDIVTHSDYGHGFLPPLPSFVPLIDK